LPHRLRFKRDYCAGGLIVLFGLVAAVQGPVYTMGTLVRMGPGYMPTALGVILIILGLIIAGSALLMPGDEEDERVLPADPQWKAWGCILAGPLLFVLCGQFGLAPGSFACVFVSALGDRSQTWKSAFIQATVVTMFGVLLFSCLLQVPMPILTWSAL
jgi:putative Ca2+/H+ antiporter (TMEM165/GDT1 family)